MTDHRVRSRVLARRPHGHRWAWFCTCGWWMSAARAEPLYRLFQRHLGVGR